MTKQELVSMFEDADLLDDAQLKLEKYHAIADAVEAVENYNEDDKLLKLYILSKGYIFSLTETCPFEIAEKALKASEIYLSNHPLDCKVNEMYLSLCNMTCRYKQAHKKAVELLQYDNRELHMMALNILRLPVYYTKEVITKNESDAYETEYRVRKEREHEAMSKQEIVSLFEDAEALGKTDHQLKLERYYMIGDAIEAVEDYSEDDVLLKLYILSMGRIFFLSSICRYDIADKAIGAAEIYLTNHTLDFKVNQWYLDLCDLTWRYEEAYKKAAELLQFNNRDLKILALNIIRSSEYYVEGFTTKEERDVYESEFQSLVDAEFARRAGWEVRRFT